MGFGFKQPSVGEKRYVTTLITAAKETMETLALIFVSTHVVFSHDLCLQKYSFQCLHSSQVAHQAGAYPGFCSMKQLSVFLLPPWIGC